MCHSFEIRTSAGNHKLNIFLGSGQSASIGDLFSVPLSVCLSHFSPILLSMHSQPACLIDFIVRTCLFSMHPYPVCSLGYITCAPPSYLYTLLLLRTGPLLWGTALCHRELIFFHHGICEMKTTLVVKIHMHIIFCL